MFEILPDDPLPLSTPDSYPDARPSYPHPWIPAGAGSTPVDGEEGNSGGLNTDRYPPLWDDVDLGRPTLMAAVGNPDPNLPSDAGQTVDMWIAREKRTMTIPRDHNRLRSRGFRGTLDE